MKFRKFITNEGFGQKTIPLGNGYYLEEVSSDGKTILYQYKLNNEIIGSLEIRRRRDYGVSVIDHAINSEHSGKGLGGKSVQELAKIYKRIHSMPVSHLSSQAGKMWQNINAKLRKTTNDYIYEIDLTH